FIHVEVDRVASLEQLASLANDLLHVLGDVRLAVEDWKKMLAQVEDVLDEIEKSRYPLNPDEILESKAFLEWLSDNHFTFIGYRWKDRVEGGGEDGLRIVPDTGLGIWREVNEKVSSPGPSVLPSNLREFARRPRLLYVTKANPRSTVHRPAYLDY